MQNTVSDIQVTLEEAKAILNALSLKDSDVAKSLKDKVLQACRELKSRIAVEGALEEVKEILEFPYIELRWNDNRTVKIMYSSGSGITTSPEEMLSHLRFRIELHEYRKAVSSD